MAVTPLSQIPSDLYGLASEVDKKSNKNGAIDEGDTPQIDSRIAKLKDASPSTYQSSAAYKKLARLRSIANTVSPAPTPPVTTPAPHVNNNEPQLRKLAQLMHGADDLRQAQAALRQERAPYEAGLAQKYQAIEDAKKAKKSAGWNPFSDKRKAAKVAVALAEADRDDYIAENKSKVAAWDTKARELSQNLAYNAAQQKQVIDALTATQNAPLISRASAHRATEYTLGNATNRLEAQKRQLVIDNTWWIDVWGTVSTTAMQDKIVHLLNSVPRVKDALMDAATAVNSSSVNLKSIDTSFPTFLFWNDIKARAGISTVDELTVEAYLSYATKELQREIAELTARRDEAQAKADAATDEAQKKKFLAQVASYNKKIAPKQQTVDYDMADAKRSAEAARNRVQRAVQDYTTAVVSKAANAISVIDQNRATLNGAIAQLEAQIAANRQAQIDAAKAYY